MSKLTRRTLLASLFAAVLAISSPAPSSGQTATNDDWALFHFGSSHSGVSPDTTIGAAHALSIKLLWSEPIGGGASYGSPVAADDPMLGEYLVYAVSSGGEIHAFTAGGTSLWSATIGSGVASPALDMPNNTVYIGDDAGTMRAFNATNGTLECTFQLPTIAPHPTPGRIQEAPVIDENGSGGAVVYFGDIGSSESDNAGDMWAMYGVGNSNGACTQYWMHSFKPNAKSHHSGTWSPPALATDKNGRNLVIFGLAQPDDGVYALDARTGAVDWRFQTEKTFPDADVGAGPTISAPGVNGIADGVVYIDGKDRKEYAIDLTTGSATPLWSFDLAANAGKSTNSVSCAALVGHTLIVAYASYVYGFNATTGALLWRSASTPKNMFGSVAVSGASGDQVVTIDDIGGHVFELSPSDGSRLATITVGSKDQFYASPAISDGMVFTSGTDGNLDALG